jgi:UDPglucose 6-dehydrogenase
MKIAVAGAGYVGLSNVAALASANDTIVYDIDQKRVDSINNRRSPIVDPELEQLISNGKVNLKATVNPHEAFHGAAFVIVATPTDYDPAAQSFDTTSIEIVTGQIRDINPQATIVIRSTIPIGYTLALRKSLKTENIMFVPEFLREGRALHDTLYPSRIVIGSNRESARTFATILQDCAAKPNVPVHFTGSNEAEAVKLFVNSYLAMRVAFFNELDSFALVNELAASQIIAGVCSDPRVGEYYNNPSFGYGGYCLPKDTKQLLSNFQGVQQSLVGAIVDSNQKRKEFIAEQILRKRPSSVGVYRLIMKTGSDNFRASSIIDVMEMLKSAGVKIIVYEPELLTDTFNGYRLVNDLGRFKSMADLILCNRLTEELSDSEGKIFTRDVFGRD